jgi:L-fuculokinase
VSKMIALLDIGKSLSKLLLIDAHDGRIVQQHECASMSVASPLGLQLDVQGIEHWLRECLAAMPQARELRAIVPIAHGAAAVLLDAQGAVLAAMDYESSAFDEVAAAYQPLRDPFAVSFSPFLPRGLNLGRQLYWLQQRAPQLLQRCAHILTYPQYWAWRFCGVLASECTSLGCHTDLWLPRSQQPSRLAVTCGWAERLPALRSAADVLGCVRSEWAEQTPINPDCQVICGMHDSSAAYLARTLHVPEQQSMAVVSSGTWTVVMARAADLSRLIESRDMLANSDIAGRAVGTARFPGGREFQAIVGTQGPCPPADESALHQVLRQGAMVLPGFSDLGGAFAGQSGCVLRGEDLQPSARVALASLYVALMTDLLLEWLAVSGEIVLDGPLANNALYAQILATLRAAQTVRCAPSRDAAVIAAVRLAGYRVKESGSLSATAPLDLLDDLQDYRWRWRRQLG